MAGKYFGIPFALSGDRSAIPDAAQTDGSVSFTQGFTLDYELENTDPNYKPVPREETNALYYDITEAIGIVQKQGFADWTISAAPYPVAAFVRHNDIVWRSNIAANSNEPGTDSTWSNTEIPEFNLPTGYFYGFKLANDGGAPNTTISVGAGESRSSDNTVDIKLTSALRGILQSAGVWAAGDNQNKLDTGAKANNTWYHVFAIRKTSDGTADILFSTSLTAPTLPSGYAGFRRISSIRTDGSGNIIGFINVGQQFFWKTPPLDVNVVTSAVDAAYVLSVPTGVRVLASLGIYLDAGDCLWSYRATDANAIPLSLQNYVGGSVMASGTKPDFGASEASVLTDTLGRAHLRAAGTPNVFRTVTYGWREL